MVFESLKRPSESPLVSDIWHSRSTSGGRFMSVAQSQWELVFENFQGQRQAILRGPESKPTLTACPPDGEWLGIRLPLGAHMPIVEHASTLVDGSIVLPNAATGFWLHSQAWEFPTYENADVFVERMARDEVIRRDPLVSETMARAESPLSLRSIQRRFLAVTGLSYTALHQIQRAQTAAQLLMQGAPISDVTFELGFYDQAHLNRLVRRLIGQTPAQLQSTTERIPLSIT